MNITRICNLDNLGKGKNDKDLGTFYLDKGTGSTCVRIECVLPSVGAESVQLGLAVFEWHGKNERTVCLGEDFYSDAIVIFDENTKRRLKAQSLKPFFYFSTPAQLPTFKTNILVCPHKEMAGKTIFFRVFLQTDLVCYKADTPTIEISKRMPIHQGPKAGLWKKIQTLVSDHFKEKSFQERNEEDFNLEHQRVILKENSSYSFEPLERWHCSDCSLELSDDEFVAAIFWTGRNKAFYQSWCSKCFNGSIQEKIFRYYEQDKLNEFDEEKIIVCEQKNQNFSALTLKNLRRQMLETKSLTGKQEGLPEEGPDNSITKFESTDLYDEEKLKDTTVDGAEKQDDFEQDLSKNISLSGKEAGMISPCILDPVGVDAPCINSQSESKIDGSLAAGSASQEKAGHAIRFHNYTADNLEKSFSSYSACELDEIGALNQRLSLFIGKYAYHVWRDESEISGKCTAPQFECLQGYEAYDDPQNSDFTYCGKGPLPMKMHVKVYDNTTNKSCKQENIDLRFEGELFQSGGLRVTGHGHDKYGCFRIEGQINLIQGKCTGDVIFLKIYNSEIMVDEKELKQLKNMTNVSEKDDESKISNTIASWKTVDYEDGIKLRWKIEEKIKMALDFHKIIKCVEANNSNKNMAGKFASHVERDMLNITDGETEFKDISDNWCLGKLYHYLETIKIMYVNQDRLYWSDNDLFHFKEKIENDLSEDQLELAYRIILKCNPQFWRSLDDEPLFRTYSLTSLYELDKFMKTIKLQDDLLALSKNIMELTCLHCSKALAESENAVVHCSNYQHCKPYRMHTCCYQKLSTNKETAICPSCSHGCLSGPRVRRLKCIQQPSQVSTESSPLEIKLKILGLLKKFKDTLYTVSLKQRIDSFSNVLNNTPPEKIYYHWKIRQTDISKIFCHCLFATGGASTATQNKKKRKSSTDERSQSKTKRPKRNSFARAEMGTTKLNENKPKVSTEERVQNKPKASTEECVQNKPKPSTEERVQNSPKASTEARVQNSRKASTEARVQNTPKASTEEQVQNKPKPSTEECVQNKPKPSSEERVQNKPKPSTEERVQNKPKPSTEEQVQNKQNKILQKTKHLNKYFTPHKGVRMDSYLAKVIETLQSCVKGFQDKISKLEEMSLCLYQKGEGETLYWFTPSMQFKSYSDVKAWREQKLEIETKRMNSVKKCLNLVQGASTEHYNGKTKAAEKQLEIAAKFVCDNDDFLFKLLEEFLFTVLEKHFGTRYLADFTQKSSRAGSQHQAAIPSRFIATRTARPYS